MEKWQSGLMQRIANPYIVGSNPTFSSKQEVNMLIEQEIEDKIQSLYPPYAWRPNLLQRSRGKLCELLPDREYSHTFRKDLKHPLPLNVVSWQHRSRWIRWYRSGSRTKFRSPVKYP